MHQLPAPREDPLGFGADVLGLNHSAFVLLRDLIAERTGVHFEDDKRDLLADKLSDPMAEHGMTSYLDYYYLLRYDVEAERHWAALMDRLAVPETYLWRQPEQLLALANCVVPMLRARRPGEPLRIWSAACCTGEEPVSIAIALAEANVLDAVPIEIVASDASGAMLERARRGLFGERSFRSLPAHLRDRYFELESGRWRIDPRLHARIRWTTANLMDAAAVGRLAGSDVIFCRNVFIYFSDEAITRVVRTFARHLRDDGYLFLGASESLTRLPTDFELAEIGGAFVYVKGTAARAAHTPAERQCDIVRERRSDR